MKDAKQELGGPGTGQQEPHALAVVEEPTPPLALAQDNSIPALMRLALQQAGPDAVAVLERLVNLQVGMEERAARKDFAAAMAKFKELLAKTPIIKDKKTDQGTDPGTSFRSTWASSSAIALVIDPICGECGFSYRWTYDLDDKANKLKTICVVTHISGHHEETPVWMPTESRAGISPQQKISSAQAYGDRLSLIGAFGLTTAEQDAPSHSYVDPTPITQEQAAELLKTIGSNGLNLQKFLTAMNLMALVELPAARLPEAKLMIEQAIQARKERAAAKETEAKK